MPRPARLLAVEGVCALLPVLRNSWMARSLYEDASAQKLLWPMFGLYLFGFRVLAELLNRLF